MKRFKFFLIAIFVTFAFGCSSNSGSKHEGTAACLGEQCTSAECIDQHLLSSKDGMLDFCQSPAFGTFSIEKDGITWYFGESVSYGQFVNGDYWVLDKGDGVEITKVTPGPTADRSGSMINPTVGVQAYDSRIYNFDPAQGVKFPAVLKGGDSLVSTISVMDSDLNQYGNVFPSWYKSTKGLGHASLMNASVLTVVSEVPKTGSFRPPYVGTDKKIYNIADIKKSILPNLKAPASLPDVAYFERGVERPWLMHMPGWTAREMHPVENMRNYHRDIGNFLSDLSLILLTDGATDKLLYGFLQTGIDHYYTIINGGADSATFEFHSILTGLLLGDESMARVWVDDKSQTVGRAAGKFYFPDQIGSNISSSKVKSGETWHGFKVMFRKQSGNSEHEHLHPSEWDSVENGGGRKQENYRHCCDSKPHFGMALTSRILKAKSYWPSQALDMYLDRWIWESINGYGYDVINQYYSFDPEWNGTGERKYILSSQFTDDIYLGFGFDPYTVAKPTDPSKYQAKALGALEPSVPEESVNTVEEPAAADTSDSSSDDASSSEPVLSNQIEDNRVITVEETSTTETSSVETSSNTVEETTSTGTSTTESSNQIEDTRVVTEETSTTGTSNQIEDTRVVTEETSTTEASNQIEDTRVVTEETSTTETSNQIEDTRVVTEETTTTETTTRTVEEPVVEPVSRVVEEEPVAETTTRTVEEPVVESVTRVVEEEAVVETTTRTVEEPVVESVTRVVEEEPVVETTTRIVEEPVVEPVTRVVEEEPVVETTTRTVEESVAEPVTRVVEEEPVVESTTRTVEEPVVESVTRTADEKPVAGTTTRTEEGPVVESITRTLEEEPVVEISSDSSTGSSESEGEASSTTGGTTSGTSGDRQSETSRGFSGDSSSGDSASTTLDSTSASSVAETEELVAKQKALNKSFKADNKARKKEFNSQKAELKKSFANGSMTRKEFVAKRKALRAQFDADNAARKEVFDADNAALLEDGPSNAIEDTRLLPGS